MIEEKLAAAGIHLVAADLDKYWICERDGFIALVDRLTGRPGTAGLVTEKGLALLIWRGEEPWFIARGYEKAAQREQVEALRRFQADLAKALTA